jgi:hypothetical protein
MLNCLNLTVAKQTKTDVAGTLGGTGSSSPKRVTDFSKPCSLPAGRPFECKAPRFIPPQAGLDFTLGEVLYKPFPVNKTRITRLWKCSRRVCLCNYEVNFMFLVY